ncbi:5'-methylthioadenosine nucleosidase [Longibacter salinarum]|uniref:5'-methylthioadenosine nucleosidase n=1 Tax=Longibacter salinarum TaxID=1850348 RepID=A0A2A8D0M8_9BACT|nr:5'-methylthioadenosine nucleosidase [Longibacter salinarum]PEN14367.1 5'-methylthioadenosine nucleosidase [Longibacter salinarum]
MTGLVFTTAEEADDILSSLDGIRPDNLMEGDILSLGDVVLGVLGVGKIKATLNTERLLRDHSVARLIHVGTCTALSDNYDVGTLLAGSFVLEGDRVHLDAPSYPRMPLDCPFETDAECTIVTQDHDIGDDEEHSYWQRIADVNDTSSYALAYVAAQRGIPCHIVKVVASQMGVDSDSFLRDRQKAHERLSSFLSSQILAEA